MNGRVAKRLRREVGGQELPQGRKYTRNAGKDGVVYLHHQMSRVAYLMDKKDYYARRREG